MANEQATQTYNSAYNLREKMRAGLATLKASRATIDAQIMDVCISIQATERMMDTLEPHINQKQPPEEKPPVGQTQADIDAAAMAAINGELDGTS